MRAGFLSPLVTSPGETFAVCDKETGRVVATKLEPALDSETRRKGLLGREELPQGVALVIAPSNAIHTFFMKFPIDVIFVRRDGQVVKVRSNVPKGRIVMSPRAFAVLELAVGGAEGVQPGCELRLERSKFATAPN